MSKGNDDTELWPSGVPIQASVIIADSNTGETKDIEWDEYKNVLTLKPTSGGTVESAFGGAGKEYNAEKTFDSTKTSNDIFQHLVSPLLTVVSEGISASLLTLGETLSGKSDLFGGTTERKGLLDLTIDGLYNFLEARGKVKHSQANTKWSFSVQFSAYELYDERVQDLLNIQNKECTITEDPLRSFVVKGTTAVVVKSAAAMHKLFEQAWGCRSNMPTDYGLSKNNATVVIQMDIVQVDSLKDSEGTEKLKENSVALRLKEPSSLSKSIFGLQAVAKVLGASTRFAPYDRSALTKITMEALGGNCITIAMACLRQGAGKSNEVTMDLVRFIQRIQNYPVPNDERVQGLLRRLRLHLKSMKKQLSAKINASIMTGDAPEADNLDVEFLKQRNQKEKLELKEKLAELNNEKENIHLELKKMRSDYDSLVTSKGKVQLKLIEVEEEKLRVSKALLDVQIDSAKKEEIASQKSFDMMNKLLQAENDILELEMKASRKHEGQTKLREGNEKLALEKKQITVEFITVKNNFLDVQKQLATELQKIETLNAEVMTLVNQKRELETTNKFLKKKAFDLEDSLKKEIDQGMKQVKQISKVDENNISLKENISTLLSEKAKLELLLKEANVKYKMDVLKLEQSTVNYTRVRDSEFQTVKRSAEASEKQSEMEKTRRENEIMKNKRSLRQSRRHVKELECQLQEWKDIIDKQKRENDDLKRSASESLSKYRLKLITLMEMNSQSQIGSDKDWKKKYNKESNTATSATSSNKSFTVKTIATESLINSFREREKKQIKQNEMLQRQSHDFAQQLSTLSSAYRQIWNQAKDLDDAEGIRFELPPLDLSEMESPTASELEQRLSKEIKDLRKKLRASQRQTSESEEKQIIEAERFASTIQVLEKGILDTKAELRVMQSENEMLKVGIGSDTQTNPQENAKMMLEMRSLQQNLLNKLNDLRNDSQLQNSQLQASLAQQLTQQTMHGRQNSMQPEQHHVYHGNSTGNGDQTVLRVELSRWENKCDNLQKSLRDTSDDLKDTKSQLRDANRRVNDLERKETELHDECKTLRRQVERLKDDLANSKREVSDYSKRLHEETLQRQNSTSGAVPMLGVPMNLIPQHAAQQAVQPIYQPQPTLIQQPSPVQQQQPISAQQQQPTSEQQQQPTPEQPKQTPAQPKPTPAPVVTLRPETASLSKIMEAPPDALVQIKTLTAANDTYKKEIDRLVEELGEKMPENISSMQEQLKDVEKRVAAALVSAAMAKAELENYQQYMKKTITAFKKKEKKYKERIRELGG